ncbi:hypothetical protein Taro_030306 [Colocasia esculenta]|uniref:non-specific serine/threonine protein kinase n=1 Tax=Colocasia esculenta TaxID=4460 RepID=A0A843VVS3_COLES|nr:hypothetical protein [Colocasia esculenta]
MKTISHALFLLLLSFSRALAPVAGNGASSGGNMPSDSILLNSGSSEDATDADGRRWASDLNNRYRLSSGNSAPAKAAFQDPSLPSQVPYMTSRVFKSASTYKFSVSGKARHYARLHFYPVAYNGLDPENAYFDVTAGGGEVTLLRNFSAYATAKALTQAYIVREFYLPRSPDGILRLTFTPSPEKKGSYAFVNGIEVVPSSTDISAGSTASLVGFSDQNVNVGSSSALQTMYRLNVGGQYLPPTNDSGLGRSWYDDSPYIFGAAFGVTYAADGNVTVRYPAGMPRYAAPLDVYTTARSMGPDPQVNMNTNLTWVFQVDANFMYVVRLHFCELQMTKINQRVFTIYVNNQTAEAAADVIGWASSPAAPVFKDYAVYVADEAGDEELWVALHPSAASKPEYYDAVLNGMEIFKLNDSAGNLAGPNPSPSDMLAAAEKQDKAASTEFGSAAGGTERTNVIGRAAGSAVAVGLVCAICFAVYRQKKRENGAISGSGGSGWLPLYGGSTGNSRSTISGQSYCGASSHLSSVAAGLCRHFSIAEIKLATKNFDESLVIGVGGFGKVYRGGVDGGTTKVAIKRSNPSSEQGVHEFQTEIEMLSKLRHRHLVSLIGYCEENGEMILVYDYMAYGTLREHLYKSNKPSLAWKQRLEICIGAARGLHYLHTGSKYPIIHRDVKTTNILLDDKWVAKVSDFGLSKTGPSNMDQTHVSTVVKGSFGYLDPEYFRRQQLTEKSDVYSFGVVLFEVLCGRPALNPSLPKEQVSLADWALLCRRKGALEDIVDPVLKGKVDPECLDKFAATAEKCLSDHSVDRPSMGDVLWNLEFALQLQETTDQGGQRPAEGCSGSATINILNKDTGRSGISESCAESDDGTDSVNGGAVFSQLINPKGR